MDALFVSDEIYKVAEIFHHGKLTRQTGARIAGQPSHVRYSSQMHSSHHIVVGGVAVKA